MSQESVEIVQRSNVAVVQRSIDAYNAEDLDGQMQTYAPDAVGLLPQGETALPDTANAIPIVGRDALRAMLQRERTAWRARYRTSELLPVGADRVLSRGKWGGVGVASGIELYQDRSVLFTLRDGLISSVEFFIDHDEALKAAGLAG